MARVTPGADATAILNDYVGAIVARSIVNGAATACGINPANISSAQIPQYLRALDAGVQAFVIEPAQQRECSARLRAALAAHPGAATYGTGAASAPVAARVSIDVASEIDIVTARNHTKTLCDDLGFGASEQVKVATVVSELARNIVLYVGDGRIELETVTVPRRGIEIRAIDRGNGIPNIDEVLSGRYRSKTGMGVGLLGTRRLMDEFTIDTGSGRGTKILVRKYL